MPLQTLQNHPLLESITSQLIQQLDQSETVLESLARLDAQEGQAFRLRLKGQRIVLYSAEEEEEGPLACILLDFSVKF